MKQVCMCVRRAAGNVVTSKGRKASKGKVDRKSCASDMARTLHHVRRVAHQPVQLFGLGTLHIRGAEELLAGSRGQALWAGTRYVTDVQGGGHPSEIRGLPVHYNSPRVASDGHGGKTRAGVIVEVCIGVQNERRGGRLHIQNGSEHK